MGLEYRGGPIATVNLGGGPCAGKGLQARALEQVGARPFETGQSYRFLGLRLNELVGIEIGMPFAEVERRAHLLGGQAIGELVAGLGEAVDEHGKGFLYTEKATALSALVSPHAVLRERVKADLRRRVRAHVGAIRRGETDMTAIVLDGRRLPEAIAHGDDIEGPVDDLLIVTDVFSDVDPIVSALRDCARRGVELPVPGEEDMPFGQTELGRAYHKAAARARDDVERVLDPNLPQADALPYCVHREVPFDVARLVELAQASGLGSNIEPLLRIGDETSTPVCRLREGVGGSAFQEGRQILLNTSRMRPDTVACVIQTAFAESINAAERSGALASVLV